ncbi:MAG: nickel-responsive transcriptional regulator NikR [Candidatus Aminicenantales bacterium]
MGEVRRFSVSIEQQLMDKFDSFIKKKGYSSRSEAIRDLMRDMLVSEEWEKGETDSVGILGLVYRHDSRELTETLTAIQHRYVDKVVASTHVHLDSHNCLEVVIFKGKSSLIKEISDRLLTTRNVKHGKLIMTTTGADIV